MEHLIEIVAQILEVNPERIRPDVRLIDLPNWDSVAAVSFMAIAETEFGVSLTANQIRRAVLVADLCSLVNKKPRRRIQIRKKSQ